MACQHSCPPDDRGRSRSRINGVARIARWAAGMRAVSQPRQAGDAVDRSGGADHPHAADPRWPSQGLAPPIGRAGIPHRRADALGGHLGAPSGVARGHEPGNRRPIAGAGAEISRRTCRGTALSAPARDRAVEIDGPFFRVAPESLPKNPPCLSIDHSVTRILRARLNFRAGMEVAGRAGWESRKTPL